MIEETLAENTPYLPSYIEKMLERNVFSLASVKVSILGQNKALQTIQVTSCARSEGKTRSAIYLAHGLAITGEKVLLVDTNIRNPSLSSLYHIESSIGLYDVLFHDMVHEKSIFKTKYNNLFIMPLGTIQEENNITLLEKEQFPIFLEKIKKDYQYIIFDGACIYESPDIALASPFFDGTVFVVECERTKWDVLPDAMRKIEFLGGKNLGLILNKRKFYIPRWLYGIV